MIETLVQSFKALSHNNRLQIVRLLMEREYKCFYQGDPEACLLETPECEFGELIDLLGVHKSTLSHHLKELKNAGLIRTQKEGRHLSIQVNRDRIHELKDFFEIEIQQKADHEL